MAKASSPSGFTSGPAASECAISECKHFTLVGIPPADTFSTSGSHIDYRSLTKKAFEKAFWILLANFGTAILVG